MVGRECDDYSDGVQRSWRVRLRFLFAWRVCQRECRGGGSSIGLSLAQTLDISTKDDRMGK